VSGRYDAVLFDAFGTLFELDRPFTRLAEGLERRLGAARPAADVERAFRAEMTHYAAQCHGAVDAATLHELRLECAAIVVTQLGLELDAEDAEQALGDSIVYRVFGDVRPALAELRARDVRTAVVSNWDYSLGDVLRGLGLVFDAVVTSAESGASKPDPAPFLAALELLGTDRRRTLHVGDTPEADGEGAARAGVDVVILDRSGLGGDGKIASLTDIAALL
jgi:HAD superfamily hydrolase (TIGR01549 family)